MIRHIVVCKDRALDAFLIPFFTPSVGVAERSFYDEVKNAESPMHKHPEDYDLYYAGTYDDDTCGFQLFDQPKLICRAQDSKESPAW
jgi:hypothetical protein